jgi:hypothetical protein
MMTLPISIRRYQGEDLTDSIWPSRWLRLLLTGAWLKPVYAGPTTVLLGAAALGSGLLGASASAERRFPLRALCQELHSARKRVGSGEAAGSAAHRHQPR